MSPALEKKGTMPSLEEASLVQQRATLDTSTTTPVELSPTTLTATIPSCWPPAPCVEDWDVTTPLLDGYEDMPAPEETLAPQQSTSRIPCSWPPAPTVEDCDEISSIIEDYDDMPALEEAVAPQQPTWTDTLGNAPSGPSPGNAHSNTNISSTPYPFPFPPPFMFAGTGFGTAGNQGQAGEASLAPFLLHMIAHAFGPFYALAVGTAPAAPPIPSATTPFPNLADMMPSLSSQLHTGAGQEDVEDESEDEDSDMPSLESAPPLETSTTPPPNPNSPPIPVPYQNPFAKAMAAFAQSFVSALPNTQATPSGTSQEPTESQGNHAPAPSAATPTDPVNSQSGPATAQAIPLPFPFPGAVTVSMGTLSGGPDGTQFTAGNPGPINPQAQESLNHFLVVLQNALATISESNPDLSSPFPEDFPIDFDGPLPPFFPFSAVFNTDHTAFSHRRPFNATEFVHSLDRVNIADIPEEDMRCPHCWLPFGTTDEDDPDFVFIPDRDELPANAERQVAFHELPFCTARPDNDPVRTPCGHIFGRGCLIETMERVNTRCPTCRQELGPMTEGPSGAS
ncbi:hypothetical protein IQ06DRAFT_296229 [Phaeosphaeriaceae sp. SRC1lsM3a]|nr:hypothetical protein IQ06DRAFT_296229 [Stagonospora sp. SRC1lsM3a]